LNAKEAFLEDMEKIMQLVRASKGLTPEPKDAISNLVNVKNPMERSGFPTYTILSQIVYLKLGYHLYGEDAEILNKWADTLCEALIAYKRQGRKEWVEAVRSSNIPEQTSFFFGQGQREPPKRRFFRPKKKEQSEFREQ